MIRAVQLLKLATPASLPTPRGGRGMSVEGLKGFKEAEKTIEDLYFTKEDQRIFSKLLKKVTGQAEIVDAHGAAGARAAEVSELKSIIGKYDVSSGDVEKLLKWKHTQH